MGVTIGPADWWLRTPEAIRTLVISSPVGTTLPDGSRIICKAGGTAWIVAPNCTQVGSQWAGGQYNSTQVGNKCCISEWPELQSRMISCGFNPADWFVPSTAQLNNPGYVCRTRWDTFACNVGYWSSTELNATGACGLNFLNGNFFSGTKVSSIWVRAFRCVTY